MSPAYPDVSLQSRPAGVGSAAPGKFEHGSRDIWACVPKRHEDSPVTLPEGSEQLQSDPGTGTKATAVKTNPCTPRTPPRRTRGGDLTVLSPRAGTPHSREGRPVNTWGVCWSSVSPPLTRRLWHG